MKKPKKRPVNLPLTLATLILLSVAYPGMAQDLVINEVMSSNVQTIKDEDGDTPDWIELYNAGDTDIDLDGFSLSDSSGADQPWIFPAMNMAAGEHLLLFASDKDRNDPPLRWETVIDWGDDWNYLVPDQSVSEWNMPSFDDSSWSSGPSGFGYGDNDDSTELSNVLSVFIRKEFTVETPEDIEEILFHIDYDDAFVAYLNGTEIARANITSDGPPPFDQPADNYNHEAQMYQENQPDLFVISDVEGLLTGGTNLLAIQIHNHSTGSSDLTAIPFLTLGRSSSGSGLSEHLTSGTKNLHTNFKIASEGEFLLLKDAAGNLLDSVFSQDLPADISIGRSPDGTGEWMYFSEPTPGEANTTSGYQSFAGEISFSADGGLYNTSVQIELSASNAEDAIYYTLDGSLPATGTLYSGPINVSETTVIRARVINPNSLPGPIGTQTYLVQTDHDLPVISLSTHPDNLWDFNEGIYVMGPGAETNIPHFGANFWQDWEKPVHIEMYEPDGDQAISQDAGTKIFGGWSRAHAQKSLAIFARNSYGDDDFDYELFGSQGLDKFSNFVLRNSGNDWNNTMFRDALLTSLFHESVDKQDYRAAVIYINGEYWGIQNIREKVNEDYLGNHYDLEPDSITILEGNAQPVEGDEQEYVDLISFINSNSLTNDENYQYVEDRIDVFNYIQYLIGNIYIDNKDWPGNNIKYWKSNQPGAKWRWIIYDTDFGFDVYNEGNVTFNTLDFALDPAGPDWPNPPWSTLLFRKLSQNQEFRELFINAFMDRLNTALLPENVLEKIDELTEGISSEIVQHLNRWDGDYGYWEENINRMRDFAQDRPAIVKQHLRNKFSLSAAQDIMLEVNDGAQGEIRINTMTPETYPWTGEYFPEVPVVLEAIPKPGFSFLRWEGDITQTSKTVEVNLEENMTVRAVFEESNSELNSVVINEINYNASDNFDTEDWVELYNKGTETIDLSGWILKDNDDSHEFVFEDGTLLGSDEYLIVCRDQDAFNSLVSGVTTIGNMDFGLSSDGDCVRLYTSDAVLTDEVCFLAENPWPSLPDGNGGTLALKDPSLDNADPGSWYGLGNHGSPGESNKVKLGVLGVENDPGVLLYPNPAKGAVTLTYTSPKSDNIRIQLLDMSGKVLKDLFESKVKAGPAEYQLDLQGVPPGVYIVKLQGLTVNTRIRLILE